MGPLMGFPSRQDHRTPRTSARGRADGGGGRLASCRVSPRHGPARSSNFSGAAASVGGLTVLAAQANSATTPVVELVTSGWDEQRADDERVEQDAERDGETELGKRHHREDPRAAKVAASTTPAR